MIRVLVVDDHPTIRLGLAVVLGTEPDIELCGSATDGESAIEMARQLLPDVVLMDLCMPGMDGLAATRAVLADNAWLRVLVLSAEAHPALVCTAVAAGAAGFLVKDADSRALIDAIRTVHHGGPRFAAPAKRILFG